MPKGNNKKPKQKGKESEEGAAWEMFKDYYHGRLVEHDGKTGVVVGELSSSVKILWLDVTKEYDIQEYETTSMLSKITDHFEPNFSFKSVIQYQESGWNRLAATPTNEDGEEEEEPMDWRDACVPAKGVKGLTGRTYPPDRCYSEGDRILDDWVDEDLDDDADYEIERIMDERYVSGNKEYLVKWKGYQLNPGTRSKSKSIQVRKGDWLPEEQLSEAKALDEWEKQKPPYFKMSPVSSPSPSKRKSQRPGSDSKSRKKSK